MVVLRSTEGQLSFQSIKKNTFKFSYSGILQTGVGRSRMGYCFIFGLVPVVHKMMVDWRRRTDILLLLPSFFVSTSHHFKFASDSPRTNAWFFPELPCSTKYFISFTIFLQLCLRRTVSFSTPWVPVTYRDRDACKVTNICTAQSLLFWLYTMKARHHELFQLSDQYSSIL